MRNRLQMLFDVLCFCALSLLSATLFCLAVYQLGLRLSRLLNL